MTPRSVDMRRALADPCALCKDTRDDVASAAAQLGKLGGKARAAPMMRDRQAEIARAAAAKRWGKN